MTMKNNSWDVEEGISLHLGVRRRLIERAHLMLLEKNIVSRIWRRDFRVWKSEPDEINNRLGWLDTIETMAEQVAAVETFVESVKGEGYTNAFLLGMGGSSLAPEVFRKIFGVQEGFLDLAVLDSTDPDYILEQKERLDLEKTLFIVSTKSGGTVETISFFKYFYTAVAASLGENRAGERFIAITDPGSGLESIAERHRFRRTFLNDPNIGGRYSALSYFGLVPAALVGVDLRKLLERARDTACRCGGYECGAEKNTSGGLVGTIMGEMASSGIDKLTFILSPALAGFEDWLEQLIAESTGKEGVGILPVVGEPLGRADEYGEDRFFVYLHLEDENVFDAEIRTLENAGFPSIRMRLRDVYDIGGQMFLWEMATAVAGQRFRINPFDQPDVESAKVLAREMVKQYRASGALPEDSGVPYTREALVAFLNNARPGDYIAVQAYVKPSTEMDIALFALREKLRKKYGLATTAGYGPRFLHSTGQLHKGDSGNGLFVQLTSDAEADLAIPDEPGETSSSITFGTLKMAQALGDKQALLAKGRRVLHFHLGTEISRNMRGLTDDL